MCEAKTCINVAHMLADLTDTAYARSHPKRQFWTRRAIHGEVPGDRSPEAGDNRWYVAVFRGPGYGRYQRLYFARDKVFDEYMPEEKAALLFDFLAQSR